MRFGKKPNLTFTIASAFSTAGGAKIASALIEAIQTLSATPRNRRRKLRLIVLNLSRNVTALKSRRNNSHGFARKWTPRRKATVIFLLNTKATQLDFRSKRGFPRMLGKSLARASSLLKT